MEEKANSKKVMTNCQFTLHELFGKAIRATFPNVPEAPVIVQPSQGEKFGDYQCNSAMAINQVMIPMIFVSSTSIMVTIIISLVQFFLF